MIRVSLKVSESVLGSDILTYSDATSSEAARFAMYTSSELTDASLCSVETFASLSTRHRSQLNSFGTVQSNQYISSCPSMHLMGFKLAT